MNTQEGSSLSRQFSRDSLCINSLGDSRHDLRGGDAAPANPTSGAGKENESPNEKGSESSVHEEDKKDCSSKKSSKSKPKPWRRERASRPSSLQFCMTMNEFESGLGRSRGNDPTAPGSDNPHYVNIWDYSDSEAAPTSSWATLPNKTLLCRPLPVDIGKCTCVIVKETAHGASDGTLFLLYTNGTSSSSSSSEESSDLLAVVMKGLHASPFYPTQKNERDQFLFFLISIAAEKSESGATYSGLLNDWDEKVEKVHQLISRVPHYKKVTRQYELHFRDKGKSGNKVRRSVKNFQLKLEENGKQTILQLRRVDKLKYILDYRYPLTGYHAFYICLASINSKLCCTK